MNQKKERWGSVLYMLVTLSIPTIIEEVLATLIQYVDTAMVGQLGEQATASVSVSTTVTWLVNSVPHAIGIGVLALIAKAVGSGDKNLQPGSMDGHWVQHCAWRNLLAAKPVYSHLDGRRSIHSGCGR